MTIARAPREPEVTLFDLDLTTLLKRTNPVCRESLEEAYQNCIQRKHATLTLGHFFFRILERQNTDIHVLLKHYAIKPADISRQFRSALDHTPVEAQASSPAIHHLIPKLFTDAWILSEKKLGLATVRSGAAFWTALRDEDLRIALCAYSPILRTVPKDRFDRELQEVIRSSSEEPRATQK